MKDIIHVSTHARMHGHKGGAMHVPEESVRHCAQEHTPILIDGADPFHGQPSPSLASRMMSVTRSLPNRLMCHIDPIRARDLVRQMSSQFDPGVLPRRQRYVRLYEREGGRKEGMEGGGTFMKGCIPTSAYAHSLTC